MWFTLIVFAPRSLLIAFLIKEIVCAWLLAFKASFAVILSTIWIGLEIYELIAFAIFLLFVVLLLYDCDGIANPCIV